MEIREVKIEEYWPLIVKNTVEFGQIAAAENPEFNRLAKCIYQVLQESFVHDATEYGVKRWESILGINPASGASLDDRKATILTYLSVKVPYTWRVLKQMLVPILGGEDKFVMEYVNDEGKLVLHTDHLDDAMLATVDELLTRVLPQFIEVVRYNHMPLPAGYKLVEYLEGADININGSYITLGRYFDYNKYEICASLPQGKKGKFFGAYNLYNTTGVVQCYFSSTGEARAQVGTQRLDLSDFTAFEKLNFVIDLATGYVKVKNNAMTVTVGNAVNMLKSVPYFLFGTNYTSPPYDSAPMRIYSFRESNDGKTLVNLVPCLDETGAPCMYDTVSKRPFYNAGAGDFLYPTDSAPAASIGLDDKFYGKLTEHGVRRLYKVPDGCTMTKDAYAAANGFKEIVEPPVPLEGYWTPQWRETDTQLILDWIETEPPMEVNENE